MYPSISIDHIDIKATGQSGQAHTVMRTVFSFTSEAWVGIVSKLYHAAAWIVKDGT